MKRTPNTTCSVCNKAIYRRPTQIEQGPVYCSLSCFGKASRKEKRCLVCGRALINSGRKKTCNRSCANIFRTGIRYNGEARKDKVKPVAALKARLVIERGTVCERCGYAKTHILEVHHRIRRCEGGTDDLDNLELICPNCHAEIHYGGVAELVERAALEKRKT